MSYKSTLIGKPCMVTGCKGKATRAVYDGNFWVLCCIVHVIHFKDFARDNGLRFEERVLE